jgi:hypothetical protein
MTADDEPDFVPETLPVPELTPEELAQLAALEKASTVTCVGDVCTFPDGTPAGLPFKRPGE